VKKGPNETPRRQHEAEGGKTEASKDENRVKTCPYRSPELKKCSK
jgi:hypothetical protein